MICIPTHVPVAWSIHHVDGFIIMCICSTTIAHSLVLHHKGVTRTIMLVQWICMDIPWWKSFGASPGNIGSAKGLLLEICKWAVGLMVVFMCSNIQSCGYFVLKCSLLLKYFWSWKLWLNSDLLVDYWLIFSGSFWILTCNFTKFLKYVDTTAQSS